MEEARLPTLLPRPEVDEEEEEADVVEVVVVLFLDFMIKLRAHLDYVTQPYDVGRMTFEHLKMG